MDQKEKLGDVFISASQSETQGLTYIEALASGIPVVAKADKCLDGVLKDNVNGYAFHNQDDFIKFLNSILYNNEKKDRLSIEAIKSTKKFSVENFANKIEELYKNMILIENEFQKISV